MSLVALSLLPYLWHYVVARLLYDQVVRPLSHGRVAGVVPVVLAGATGFLAGRIRSRRG